MKTRIGEDDEEGFHVGRSELSSKKLILSRDRNRGIGQFLTEDSGRGGWANARCHLSPFTF